MEVPRQREKCTTGCPVLDQFLDGGMPCGSVCELVGESTAGKTQLALQLLVAVQLPRALRGLDGSAIYISAEGYFPGRRLKQIADKFKASRSLGFDPCNHVFVERVVSIQEVLGLLERFALQRCERRVRLLVIDSVAALFRTEFENNMKEMVARAQVLFQLAATLHRIAHKFDMAVVVTNQVMDCIEGSTGIQIGNMQELWSSGRRVWPALGLAWSHCVNMRLFLSRTEDLSPERSMNVAVKRQRLNGDVGELQASCSMIETNTIRRIVHVVFAPHLPYRSCAFVVDENGVHGVTS